MFQSYQFRQINPDLNQTRMVISRCWCVSIVSIQADQSRRLFATLCDAAEHAFQSYQFRQINPDLNLLHKLQDEGLWFQSYQFRQINPDKDEIVEVLLNEKVSIVSIQADQSRLSLTV